MHWADVIVLASHLYFIDAQMKTVIDRTLAQWTKLKDKEFYYIMACADEDRVAMNVTLECFRGFVVCLGGSKEKGVVYGTGTYEAGSVKTKKTMQEAYEMGKGV
jgi:multimeric flavodoxin WrbA